MIEDALFGFFRKVVLGALRAHVEAEEFTIENWNRAIEEDKKEKLYQEISRTSFALAFVLAAILSSSVFVFLGFSYGSAISALIMSIGAAILLNFEIKMRSMWFLKKINLELNERTLRRMRINDTETKDERTVQLLKEILDREILDHTIKF